MRSNKFLQQSVMVWVLVLVTSLSACSGENPSPTPTVTPTIVTPILPNPAASTPTSIPTNVVASPTSGEPDRTPPSSNLNPGDYVVQLRVFGCPELPRGEFRSLTGFFVSGKKGIVTALHGIAGCQQADQRPCFNVRVAEALREENNRKSRQYGCLHLVEADVERDLAHVYSSELDQDRGQFWPADGISTLSLDESMLSFDNWPCSSSHEEEVRIFGYPGESESSIKRRALALCAPILRQLLTDQSKIPLDILGYLTLRDSPSLQSRVLHIDGTVEPGDSGAPVLWIKDNRLLGVVLGGIPEAPYVAWAIPWSEVQFSADFETTEDLSRLKELGPGPNKFVNSFNVLWGFSRNYTGEKAKAPPAGIDVPPIKVDETRVWHGDISVVVYTPVDACLTILTDNYFSPKKAMISQTLIQGSDHPTELLVGMTRLPQTSQSVYQDFCSQADKKESLLLYAYLYERQGEDCIRPLSTEDGLVYDEFELHTTNDVWSTGFCADKDIRFP